VALADNTYMSSH